MRRRALLLAATLSLAPAVAPAVAAAGEAKAKGGKDTPAETYLPLGPINTSVASSTGARTLMTVEVGLDVPDAALRDHLSELAPRLRSAFLEVIQVYGATLAPGSPPNADLLAQRLQQNADQVLGRSGARLLLASLVVN